MIFLLQHTGAEEYEDPLTGMASYEYDERLESNLNTEASMVVLEVAEVRTFFFLFCDLF